MTSQSPTDPSPATLHIADAVATITLDTPHNRNALSTRMVATLRAHLADAAADESVRAVVLTHTGGTFCAGVDLTEAREGSMETGTRALLELLAAIVELPKPVLARLDGHVRAGGMGIVGACDLAVAGPAASFAFTEVRIGIAPAVISLTTAPRMSARGVSRYYLTGETFDGATAARVGLIDEVADSDAALEAAVGGLLASLRVCSPQGLRETKSLTTAAIRAAIEQDGPAITELSSRLFASDEATEGMTAFKEKRRPGWALRG